jgi:hypothetical protein
MDPVMLMVLGAAALVMASGNSNGSSPTPTAPNGAPPALPPAAQAKPKKKKKKPAPAATAAKKKKPGTALATTADAPIMLELADDGQSLSWDPSQHPSQVTLPPLSADQFVGPPLSAASPAAQAEQARIAKKARPKKPPKPKVAKAPAVPPRRTPQQAASELQVHLSQPGVHWGTKQKPNKVVKAAQRDMGMRTTDGIVGPKTRERAAALGSVLPPRG